ncbi:MAG: hypothetical protein MZV65_40845 [Chromatiales bacterium]|nr:hypothetical protein [Chromatiales bacterium]
MSITNVAAGSSAALQGAGNRLYLAGASEFADKLTVGQILKGRVLRQYDQSRYLVGFDGNERVVDSAVPLRTGELLHGRVMAVGERVEPAARVCAGRDRLWRVGRCRRPVSRWPRVPGHRQRSAARAADRALSGNAQSGRSRPAGQGRCAPPPTAPAWDWPASCWSKLGLPQSSELLGAL